MITPIELVFLTACYSAAIALEVSRLFMRIRLRGPITLTVGACGLIAHTLFLVLRTLESETPLSSFYDWYMLAAWVVAASYLYLALLHSENPIGLFLLPLVLALIAVALLFADRNSVSQSEARSIWGTVHAAFLLAGTVTVMIGFAAGLMYLMAAYRLKHKLPPKRGFELPNLEWLERINSRAVVVSVPLLGGGLVSALVLNLVKQRLLWNDPLIWILSAAVAWLTVTAVFNVVYRPARQGRKVAYLTVSNFCVLVVCLGSTLFVETEHSGAPPEGNTASAPAVVSYLRTQSFARRVPSSMDRSLAAGRRKSFVQDSRSGGAG